MTQLIESFKMAIAALTANKLRAVLTTLGVVIGITTVLLMGWALSGLDNAVEQTLSIFGDDVLYVDKYDWTGQTDWLESRNRRDITFATYVRVKDRIKTAESVVPTVQSGRASIRYGDQELVSGPSVVGTTADYVNILGGKLSDGRFFNEQEDEAGGLQVVIAYNVRQNLFGEADPIGRTIKINGIPFTVIGSLPKRGALGADFVDNEVIIPIKRFYGLFGTRASSVTITVKAGGVDKMEDVRYETIGVMREVRSLPPGTKDDFAVNTQEQFRRQTDQLRVVVWAVGLAMTGLSFLVGSIGIMNIMFVSVTERTKEIGIRKAVGATRRSILIQFLVESVILCGIGAVIAFAITSTIAAWLPGMLDTTLLTTTVPASQVAFAVFVSVAVGVLAGIIPAFRASRLDPVEALRAD